MNPNDERLLECGLIELPEDFAVRVMASIAQQPVPPMVPTRSRRSDLLQKIALTAAALLGAAQLAAFMFALWAASNAA